jgi:hypothetical protein
MREFIGAPKASKEALTSAGNDEKSSTPLVIDETGHYQSHPCLDIRRDEQASQKALEASTPPLRNNKSMLRSVTLPKPKAKAAMTARSAQAGSRFMAPDLVPIFRGKISSTLAVFNGISALQQGTTTYVADPTGNATNALGVFQWSTRFSGFQQYRIRSTEWVLTPIRYNLTMDTPGYTIGFVEDDPQAGAASQAVALASFPRARVCHQSLKPLMITYGTNEPGDLDLSDINTPPNKIVNGSINQGQHCLNLYTDQGFFGFQAPASGTIPLIGVQAIYDVEFFGIGGV